MLNEVNELKKEKQGFEHNHSQDCQYLKQLEFAIKQGEEYKNTLERVSSEYNNL